MRGDLTELAVTDELAVELTRLTSYRADVMADWVRGVNRLRDLLSCIFPALEASFDYSARSALILVAGYCPPAEVRAAGPEALAVAHGLGHGLIGAAVGAWPAVALVGSYELLMMIIRREQVPAVTSGARDDGSATDPLGERAAMVFADELKTDRLPSVRAIRAALHVGQPRAQRLRGYLAIAAETRGGKLAA
jgi:hypothetical protein